jgi:lipopolysaccharide transport system permease protein
MQVTVIKPTGKLQFLNLREIWPYRELLFSFVKRDIQVRYRQTVIGGLWAIIQPFTHMVIFSFFFGHLAKISGGGVPYPVFSYSGLLLWTYFTNALSVSSGSMVASSSLITKVYFPRIIIPIAATMSGLVDYAVASIILIGLMFYYQIMPTAMILLAPLTLLLTWLLSMGIGFWLSAINVKYRDVGYILPFCIQLLLFVTPVIYPSSIAPNFKILLSLNPMTGIIDAHRAMMLGGLPVDWGALFISTFLVIIILFTGSAYFKSVEKYFADII